MCREARELSASLSSGDPQTLLDALSALLLIADEEPIGRPSISRILGIGDKRARNIVAKLREAGLVDVSRAGARLTGEAWRLLRGIRCLWRNGFTIAVVPCSDVSREHVERSVIPLRDAIVITLSEPRILDVVGWVDEKGLLLPRLEGELAEHYRRLIGGLRCGEAPRCLIGVFHGSAAPCYRCCASLLHAASTL